MENLSVPLPEAPQDAAQALEDRISALAEQWSARLDSRQEALETRENALRNRELAARAREALEARGLPASLSACLSFQSEEALEKGVPALEEAFRAAVQQSVEARLTASAPKAAPLKPLSDISDEEYYAAIAHQ